MGLGDYYGYTFFFDNDGVLRYEMVLEGFHSDRFLYTDGGLYTCVSSRKIALMSPLGQAVRVYDLGQYELHHDINWGPDGTILALVNDTEQDTVMDVVISLDPATGEVLDVIEAKPLALAVLGENVYYLDSADNLLYSYHTADGTILQAVEGVPMRSLRRVNTELRYVTQEDAEGLLSLN